MVLEVFLGHANAIILDLKPTFVLIDRKENLMVFRRVFSFARNGEETVFINRVTRVRNQFAKENFLVGINGVDHQVQKLFGLGFKLFFFFHLSYLLLSFSS